MSVELIKNVVETIAPVLTYVELIKNVVETIAPVLTYIINLSFQSGVFPASLKKSIIVPLYKKPNSKQIDNIRPISLLSVFSKIFEKCMKVRLVNYLHSIIFQNIAQFGFTKGKSTEDALINVVNKIHESMNNGKKTTGLFVDFRKAFDLVKFDLLLKKMENAGIRGVALQWFTSFLIGRTQQVKIGNFLSTPRIVKSGVPQGSVISATLFLIFINDLLQQRFSGTVWAFADDIALLYSNKNKQELWLQITNDLKFLKKWCFENKMSVNVSKTKFINFDFKGFRFQNSIKYHDNDCDESVTCDCNDILQVNEFQYLGVHLDEKMT